MTLSRYLTAFVVSISAILTGCNETGACMMHFAPGEEEVCSEVKKSVCDEGKDRFIGGKCPAEKKKSDTKQK